MAKWLATEGIVVPLSTFSGDKDNRNISFGFSSDVEGKRFAERFGGEVRPDLGSPTSIVSDGPVLSERAPAAPV